MTATIILSEVSIALGSVLIICVSLYALCKMACQDEKERNRDATVREWQEQPKNIKPTRSQREKGLREYVEERVKENAKQ